MAHIVKDRVKETTTTTGTGALTLSGAMTGFRAFSAVCSVGDTCRYGIQAVDSNGLPTGDWEVGYGTYSASNTLTRTTVVDSSNAGSAVSFSAGTKQVWIGMDAAMAAWVRERLTADRTYYVRTDGSDSNNGLANTTSGAFLTIQKAVDTVADTVDLGAYNVVIQVADGTYTGAVSLRKVVGRGTVTIRGNTSNNASVIISTTSATCITNISGQVGTWYVEWLKMTAATSGNCVYAGAASTIILNNVNFGSVTSSSQHMMAEQGGKIQIMSAYTISGGAYSHFTASGAGSEWRHTGSYTVTISGSPTFTTFANATSNAGVIASSVTYSGAVTAGARYSAVLNAIINTFGGGASYFPGSTAGSTATGGQYN